MFVDFHGFTDPSGVPVWDAGDELCLMPTDVVVHVVRVFDNGGFVILSSSAMGFVFLKRCGDLLSRFPDADLATFTCNLVYAWLGLGALLVFVGTCLEVVADLVGCVVENLDFVFQDALDGV